MVVNNSLWEGIYPVECIDAESIAPVILKFSTLMFVPENLV